MKKIFITLAFIAISTTIFAGNSKKEPDFFGKLTFKPVVTIFADYRLGLNNVTDKSKLSLKRSYLGFKLDNGGEWSGQVIFDIFDATNYSDLKHSDLVFNSYLKNASVTWKRSHLEINLGIIKTNNFGVQEKSWGLRYIMKSFSDEFGIAPSADLGISASYKFYDWLKADVTITNGKGYKDLEMNENFRYGLGLTFKPMENLTIRAHYDIYMKDNRSIEGGIIPARDKNQHTIMTFAEYKREGYSVSGEYTYMLNSDFERAVNRGGVSLYSTVRIIDKLSAFVRYDNYYANNDAVEDRGCGIRTGVDYRPFKFLRISPNIYNWKPTNMPSQTYLFLNLLINF